MSLSPPPIPLLTRRPGALGRCPSLVCHLQSVRCPLFNIPWILNCYFKVSKRHWVCLLSVFACSRRNWKISHRCKREREWKRQTRGAKVCVRCTISSTVLRAKKKNKLQKQNFCLVWKKPIQLYLTSCRLISWTESLHKLIESACVVLRIPTLRNICYNCAFHFQQLMSRWADVIKLTVRVESC